MSQPMDRTCEIEALGEVDESRGEFWFDNPFQIPASGENLSAYETNRLYTNLDGNSFMDVSFSSGVDIDSDSRSIICADFNNDGANDMLIASVGGGPLRLFINQYPDPGNYLRIGLKGTKSNRAAIGTKIVLHCGDQQIVRQRFPANGFMGQGPTETIVGIGKHDKVDRIEVQWPTGETQAFENVSANQTVQIIEGQGELQTDFVGTDVAKTAEAN